MLSEKIRHLHDDIIRKKKTRRVFVLYSSYIFSMVLGFVSSILVTKYLPPEVYGNVAFLTTLFSFLDTIITFGFFQSASQALLHETKEKKIKEIIGVVLLIAFLMGIFICIISILLSNSIDKFMNLQIASTIRLLAPLMIVMPIRDSLSLIFQSTNRIFLLSLLNVLPSIISLSLLVVLPKLTSPNLVNVIFSQRIGLVLVSFILIIVTKPCLNNVVSTLKKILNYQKSYGFPVYIAVLCSVATQQINRMGIAYWVNSETIGYYNLSTQLVEPLRLIPGSVATASFKNFSENTKISKKAMIITIGITFIALLGILLLLGKPLEWFYPKIYVNNISQIASVLAFSAGLQGFAEFINKFLGSHGRGKDLRNTAIVVGIFNTLGFLVLTRFFGIWGTVSSNILSNSAFLIIILSYYRKFQTSQKIEERT